MNHDLFTPDFKSTPYWWERTPRPDPGENGLPDKADVLIIGSGYTGLSAAIETTKRDRHTVVIDAQDAGWGCSSRNGGQISPSIKPTFGELKSKYGADAALAILTEGNNALNWVESVVNENRIDCDFRRTGRFYGAHSPAALDMLRKKIEDTPRQLNHDAFIVERDQQYSEIGSDFYHGGIVHPYHASIDPGRYHQGLLDNAKARGAQIISHCEAKHISSDRDGHRVKTSKGTILAKQVIVATSGYTTGLTPWQRRRIIPIGSYIIATEPLPNGLPEQLIPKARVITDTLKIVVYYRLCPQHQRILFGGRVSITETNPETSAPKLRKLMLQRFPELESVKISHSWMGFVGYTFDAMPHIGTRNDIHYSMGYCGAGISLASYFGMKAGLKAVGDPEGKTAIDHLAFPGRLWYRRKPWFLAPSIFYYRWRDNRKVA